MKKTENVHKTGRILLMQTGDGEKRVGIPVDAKITFGPSVPGPKEKSYGGRMDYAVRVYRNTKDNLLAVFTGVYEFRELCDEITVEKLIVREAGKSVWKSDEEGYSVNTEVKRRSKLVPDVKLLNAKITDEDPF